MKRQIYRAIVASAFLSIALSGNARSQQETPPSQESQDKDKDKDKDQDKDKDANTQPKPDVAPDNSTTPMTLTGNVLGPNSDTLQVHQMGGAKPLPTGRVSAIQFGPVYLQNADFYQELEVLNVSNQPNTQYESVSLFRADLVFDHAWRASRVAVQYEPRLTITNGQVQASTSNLDAQWNTLFTLTPRLSLGLKDDFGYYGQQAQFDGLNLEADLTTGTLVQAHFLDGPGHFLNNRAEAEIRYLVSPRNHIDITPFFDYYSASGDQAVTVTESKSPGAELAFYRLLSPTRTMGFGYAFQDTFFGNMLPRTLYQTGDLTYAQQVSPTWRYSATVGVTRASTSLAPPDWTLIADLNVIKQLRGESTLAFQYYRGEDTGLQVTNGFADRYDASYTRHLQHRTRLTLGVGYYRQFLAATNTAGFYTSAGIGYQIAQRWFLEGVYTYKDQRNGGANFTTGTLQFAAFGIRWEPGLRPAGFR